MTRAPTDPVRSARDAGLHYTSDARPGIRRRRRGKGFEYFAASGRRIRDRATLERIRKLAVPPAYTDVWICADPLGHLQATGRDARGRKQYRYHPRFREMRDETKFDRMLAFSRALPRIRKRVHADIARPGMPREKVLAAVVRLLESTGMRVGNDEYARDNGHFGLSTLHNRHVAVRGAVMRFQYAGKHGKRVQCHVTDLRLARIVRRCQALPGQELFEYVDDDGVTRDVGSGDVNEYLREIAGDEFTAKDFRTWAGTLLAVEALREVEPLPGARGVQSAILRAIEEVAEHLNNTRAVCRKYYVHPAVLDAFSAGDLRVKAIRRAQGNARGLSRFEIEVCKLLRHPIRLAAKRAA